MSEPHRLYRYTSIGRPLDPAYPTNLAVLVLLPVVGVAFATLALVEGASLVAAASAALRAALVLFGSWALAREIDPDHELAAFVAAAVALLVYIALGAVDLLILFVALFSARIVNRSTGQAAKWADSIAVLALAGYAAWHHQAPLVAIAAALAFALDAGLARPLHRHAGFAVLAVAIGWAVWVIEAPRAQFGWPTAFTSALAMLATAWCATGIARRAPVGAPGDTNGETLSSGRVAAAIGVVWFVAAQSLAPFGSPDASVVWATIVGLAVAAVARAAKSASQRAR